MNKLRTDALIEIGQALETVRDTTHQAVKSWQKELKASAQVLANTVDIREAAEELLVTPHTAEALIGTPAQTKLRAWFRAIQAGTGYQGYLIIGPDNINLASSRNQNIGHKTLLATQKDFLKRVWSGERVISVPEYSDVPLSDMKGNLRIGIPTMFVAAPIFSDSGGVIAIFLFHINPAEGFTAMLQQGRIGSTGETYAFDNRGRLISNSRFDDHLRQIGLIASNERGILNIEIRDPGVDLSQLEKNERTSQQFPFTRMAESAIAGKPGIDLQGYRDYRGIEVVGAWLWDTDLGLGITTELDKSEAYHSLRTTRKIIVLFTVFSILLLIALTVILIINHKRKLAEQDLRIAHDHLDERVHRRTVELANTNEELRKLLRAVQQSPASIVITDIHGTIQYVNPKFTETTGYSYEEAIGQNPRIVNSGKQSKESYQAMWETILSGKVWHGEFQNKKKNGELFWEKASISPIVNEQGEMMSFVAVKEDVTEQRLAEENERQRLLELAHISRLSTMGEMATQIAHELNQPLAAIASTSDALDRLITSSPQYDSEVHAALGNITSQAQRAGEIIRHLRSFVRKEPSQHGLFDINEVIQDVLQLIGVEMRRHEISVSQDLSDCLLEVNGDRILIEQVILNLIRNAIDAMSNNQLNEKALSIKTQITGKEELKVSVTNTGPGLSDEAMTQVFEPFYTTKASGMGMGLSISRSIVESHGGKLWVTSGGNQGITFCFTLPVTCREEDSDVA